MSYPERSPERDAALDTLVATIPFAGWSVQALREAAGPDADLLFPQGPVDMVEAWIDAADRRMDTVAFDQARVPDRVRAAIAFRLDLHRPAKDAVRRGLALLATRPGTAAAVTARTVDAIWHAAGDRSADWSWYSKRAILAGVYGSTLLFWLRDDTPDDSATLAFLDRRLAGVGRIGRLRRAGTDFRRRWLPSHAA